MRVYELATGQIVRVGSELWLFTGMDGMFGKFACGGYVRHAYAMRSIDNDAGDLVMRDESEARDG